MHVVRKIVLTTLSSGAILAVSAAAASAANVYVATTGSDSNTCRSASDPCLTLYKAVQDGEAIVGEGNVTIHVADGTYEGATLNGALDDGDTIVGASQTGTVLENVGPGSTLETDAPATLEDLTVRHDTHDTNPAIEDGSESLTLRHVNVESNAAKGEDAIRVELAYGTLSLDDCRIIHASTGGAALKGTNVAATITNSTLEALGDEAEAVAVSYSTLTLERSTAVTRATQDIAVRGSFDTVSISRSTVEAGGPRSTALQTGDSTATVDDSRLVARETEDIAVESEEGTVTLEGDTIEADAPKTAGAFLLGNRDVNFKSDTLSMNAAADTREAILLEGVNEATFRRVRVHGTWTGQAMLAAVRSITLLESSISDGSTQSAVAIYGFAAGHLGVLVQRSRIAAPADAKAALYVQGNTAAAIDSSLIVGGVDGVLLLDRDAKKQQDTIAASTIDAGTPGQANEAGVASVSATLEGEHRAFNVNVEGSVLFEPITATLTGGASGLAVSCQNTDVLSQDQVASATVGSIGCRTGAHGNDNFRSPSSIFASPVTNYLLKNHTKAVNSVPSDTISLGYGVKPAAYDLLARRRDDYERVSRKCDLVQDRGAAQIRSQKSDCKPKRSRRRRRR